MRKYQYETVAGVFLVIGLLCIAYMTVKLGKVSFFGDGSYVLNARFTTVSGLRVGNPVRMFGLEIGRVGKLGLDQKDQMALVQLRLNKDVKIYGDGVASIKSAGLIGDRYIDISPGGAEDVLNPGATIPQTQPPLDIEELIGKYAFGDVKKKDEP